jgi:hypothetical protein
VTPVGHSLTGLALGVLGAPRRASTRARLAYAAIFVVLPNTPDLPLPGWGHSEYAISHSLLANAALVALTARLVAASPRLLAHAGGPRGLACAALAWMSHLLLDAFYNHHKGVAIYWPFSDAHLDLGMPWFRTLHRPRLDAPTARILVVEAVFYGMVLLAAVAARALEERRRR